MSHIIPNSIPLNNPVSGIRWGTFLGSGNLLTTQFTTSHGMGIVPSSVIVGGGSNQVAGVGVTTSANASSITITYVTAPLSGDVRIGFVIFP